MAGGWVHSNRRDRLPPHWDSRIAPTILRRDDYNCQLGYACCTTLATEVDHIAPGDDHHPDNLQAVCTQCHARKSSAEGVQARRALAAQTRRPSEPHPGWIGPPTP